MLFKSLASAAIMATSAVAAAVAPRSFSCGTDQPSREHLQISKALAAKEAELAASGNFTVMAAINVNVYVHVVAASTSLADGYVTVSHSVFSRRFCLRGLVRWLTPCSPP